MQPAALAKKVLVRAGVRRHHLACARMCVERNLIPLKHGRKRNLSPRVLCYHSVGTRSWGVNDVHPRRFRRQLESALESGRRFVPAQAIAAGNGQPGDIAITFDDGLRSVAANAAPVLKDLGIPWTMFVVTDWADGRHEFDDVLMTWGELEKLAEDGATLASHSVSHAAFSYLTPVEVAHELAASRDMLHRRLGIDTREFAIPLGLSKDWPEGAQETAKRIGYEAVYAQAESARAIGTVPRTFIGRFDTDRVFKAAINGAFDDWEEFR